MTLTPIRPRFRLEISASDEEGIALVEAAVARPDSRSVSRVLGNHLDITIDQSERRRWSPCVQLEFEQQDSGTLIHGLIGPQPNTWTWYAFVYLTVAFGTLFGSVFGIVQWLLDQPAWGMWFLPAGVLLALLMYAAARTGQHLATEQTNHLDQLVRQALK